MKHKRAGKRLRQRNQRIKRVIVEKYGCCNDECSWVGPLLPGMVDFHHLNAELKVFDIGPSVIKSLRSYLKEILKCITLCSNCHRMVTHGWLTVDHIEPCQVSADDLRAAECYEGSIEEVLTHLNYEKDYRASNAK